jgi:predicted ATPase/DNA-binding SARP family transcriptional activator/Tfp pilus assembly protein PilF
MFSLRLFLFGVPRAERAGQAVPIRRRKVWALLTYLAVTGQPHSRDALATMFWPENDQSSALANLRRDLSRLKRAVGDEVLEVDRLQIGLVRQTDPSTSSGQGLWLDVEAFKGRLAAVQAHGHAPAELCAECVEALTQAVSLYTDDFMAGFSLPDSREFDEWQFFQAEGLRQSFAEALEQLVGWHTGQAEFEQGVEYARRWVALDPLHEEAQRQLMQLYAWSGQQAAALRQYQECARLLEEELGVEPEPETTALYEAIRTKQSSPPPPQSLPSPLRFAGRTAPAGGMSAPSGTVAPAPPHNLPPQATPFVGREEELADIGRLLREEPACRLLTLVGPGGIGKTRLALEAAEGMLDAFSDGVYFVPLASVGGTEFMVAAIAQAIDFDFSSGVPPRLQLLNHLRAKRLLLVVDNLEHLLEGVGLFSEILSAAPQARLLVTSRERLHLQEEWVYEVQGLPCPEAVDDPADLQAYSAACLFLERARQADANFDLSAEEIPALVRICQLVAGMPLGLELAAAWARSMSCREIAAEIARNLDFLTTTLRNVPERHHSLRAIFEQSWERLTDAEREVLSKLSVFQGGCSREAAEVVAGATLPVLASLGDKSLLRRTDSGRYEMHGLIHQFAAEQLAADPASQQALQDRHCTYYGSFLEGRIPAMEGDRQREALAEIAVEIDNVRAGWRYALVHLRLDVLRAFHWGLGMFFWLRGWFEEARDTFDAAAQVLECEPDVIECQEMLVQILVSYSTHCQFLGQTEPAEAALEKGLAVAERLNRPALVAAVLDRQSRLAAEQGGYVRAGTLGARALSIYEELDDPVKVAHVLTHQGAVSLHLQEYETARRQLQASIARHRRLNKLPDLMMGLSQMARVLYRTGAYAEAQEYLEEVVAICERMNTPIHASVYNNLGQVAEAQGEYELAREHYLASLAYYERVHNEPRRGTPLAHLGNLARIAGDFEEASHLLHEGLEIHQKHVSVREVARDTYLLGLLAQAEGDVPTAQERFDGSHTLYEADENRHGMALALHGLGEVALERDELERARGYLERALELAAGIGAHPVTTQILLGWARYRLARGETEEGLYLLAFVGAQSAAHHETRERARALWAERSAPLAPGQLAEIRSRAGGATLADVVARYLAAEAEPVLQKAQPHLTN